MWNIRSTAVFWRVLPMNWKAMCEHSMWRIHSSLFSRIWTGRLSDIAVDLWEVDGIKGCHFGKSGKAALLASALEWVRSESHISRSQWIRWNRTEARFECIAQKFLQVHCSQVFITLLIVTSRTLCNEKDLMLLFFVCSLRKVFIGRTCTLVR